jgi:type IV secretory pathway VirB2 component (pilin)
MRPWDHAVQGAIAPYVLWLGLGARREQQRPRPRCPPLDHAGSPHLFHLRKRCSVIRMGVALQLKWLRPLAVAAAALILAVPVFAQGNSPWENAVQVLQQAFTSTIARGLSLVAIVVSGLTFAFGEGGSKRVLAGVLFGVGMAIAAVNFLAWLFPG